MIGRSCCGDCNVSMLMSSMNLCHNSCADTCAGDGSGLSEELQEHCVLEMRVQVAGAVQFHHRRALESSSPLGSSLECSLMPR